MLRKKEEGSVLIFVALLLPVLIGFIGLSIDGGRVLLHKARLSEATEFAAKSALLMSYDRDLWESQRIIYVNEDDARRNADIVLKQNCEFSQIDSIEIVNNVQIVLSARSTVEFSFMKIFGFDRITIRDKRWFTISSRQ